MASESARHGGCRPASGCRVVSHGTGFAGADGDHAVARQPLVLQVLCDRVGTPLGELLVVIRGSGAVSMSGRLDHRLVVLLDDGVDSSSALSLLKVMLPGMLRVMLSPMRVTLTPVPWRLCRGVAPGQQADDDTRRPQIVEGRILRNLKLPG